MWFRVLLTENNARYKTDSENNSVTEGQTDCFVERVARTDGIEFNR